MEKIKNQQFLDVLRTELASVISRIIELPQGQFIVVSKVSFQENKRSLRVFVTIFPTDVEHDIMGQLIHQRQEVLKELKQRFPHRNTPNKLHFLIDEQAQKASEVETILDSL